MRALIESLRTFQLWRYVVGHGQLLLRSNPTSGQGTRVEVLFKDVRAIKLPTLIDGLVVREPSEREAMVISEETGELESHDCKFFVVDAGQVHGYVVAGFMTTNEDDGNYADPSALLAEA